MASVAPPTQAPPTRVLAVTLNKPHVPLRSTYDTKNPSFDPKGIALWTAPPPASTNDPPTLNSNSASSLGVTESATVALSKTASFSLTVTLQNFDTSNYPPWSLHVTDTLYCMGDTEVFHQSPPSDGSSISVHVDIQLSQYLPDNADVPWGLEGELQWEFNTWYPTGGAATSWLNPTPISLFAIVEDIAPYWQVEKGGSINIDFLRLFVLPTNKLKIRTLDEWIGFVVQTCHASSWDPDLASNPQAAKTAVHSYRYNVWNGAPRFVDDGGSVFYLDSWCANRMRSNGWYTVNCYDMSALLQVALSLGLPWHLQDANGQDVTDHVTSEKFQTVGKVHKEPYGFIKKTDLIGWGNCDNPFFMENPAQQLLNNPADNPIANGRDSFGDHAFVYIRTDAKNPQTVSVSDACAGPCINESIDTYITNNIDMNAGKYYMNTKDLKPRFVGYSPTEDKGLKYCKLYNGVQSLKPSPLLTSDHTVSLGKLTGLDPFDKWNTVFRQQLDEARSQEVANPKSLPVQIPISEMFNEVASRLVALNPTITFDLGDKMKPTVITGIGNSHIEWDICVKTAQGSSPSAPYLIMIVDVCNTTELALQKAASAIGMTTAPMNEAPPQDKAGFVHYTNPGTSLNVMVYGNISFQIQGLLPAAQATTLTTYLDTFISAQSVNNQATISVGSVKVDYPLEVRYNQDFNVVIHTTQNTVKQTDLVFKNNFIRTQQDPVQGPTGVWTIQCRAIAFDKDRKYDEMHVVYADNSTYMPSVLEYPINILPA